MNPVQYKPLGSMEWECKCCHCYNDDCDERCWNCNADVDGEGTSLEDATEDDDLV